MFYTCRYCVFTWWGREYKPFSLRWLEHSVVLLQTPILRCLQGTQIGELNISGQSWKNKNKLTVLVYTRMWHFWQIVFCKILHDRSFNTFVCAAGKIYFMSAATCILFKQTLHIQSIYNNLKRGLVVSTHQLLSSPIFEYNTFGIMHNGCDR